MDGKSLQVGSALSTVNMKNGFTVFGNKKILFINKSNYNFIASAGTKVPLKIDLLVVSDNFGSKLRELSGELDIDKVIFDSSNSKGNIIKSIAEAKKMNLPYYSVPDNGAFVLDRKSVV